MKTTLKVAPVMTAETSMAVRAGKQIEAVLIAHGFSAIRKLVAHGRPLVVEFRNVQLGMLGEPDPKWSPHVDLYEVNAYPNDRDEVFLNVWNAVGRSVRAPGLAAALTQAGFPARVTTHRGDKGIRVKVKDLGNVETGQ